MKYQIKKTVLLLLMSLGIIYPMQGQYINECIDYNPKPCADNFISNGNFNDYNSNPRPNNIQVADDWSGLWSGGHRADLCCGSGILPKSYRQPKPACGVFAACWIQNYEQYDLTYREGFMNQLKHPIKQNSGTYNLRFNYACLNKTLPNKTVYVGIWGIQKSAPVQRPSSVFSPLTADLFGNGNAVLLATLAVPPGIDHHWEEAQLTFSTDAADFPYEIDHLAITHDDIDRSRGGRKYMAFDNFCLTGDLYKKNCCRNRLTFWADSQVPPSYYFSGNSSLPPLTYAVETFRVQAPSNIPITDLYASVTSVEYISNNEECKQCSKDPIHFGSIYSFSNIGYSNPLIRQSIVLDKSINNSEIHWKNPSGTSLTNGMQIPIIYTLPVGSSLSCCKTSMKVCIRFRYIDKKCNICEIFTCSTIPLRNGKKSSRAYRNSRTEQQSEVESIFNK